MKIEVRDFGWMSKEEEVKEEEEMRSEFYINFFFNNYGADSLKWKSCVALYDHTDHTAVIFYGIKIKLHFLKFALNTEKKTKKIF